ncbi:1,4-dihydroxy-6-naphthoate synthase [Sphingobacterium sp. DK4209]|uniref:1,4-dihydroxy-6-naphtoate synthase n=1 Tax=Sphingobacterium zhuxiongii TaxID=2662364 RepID=A0A5Q0Q7P3_9SPHI|nr:MULTISPECIES: 1,4-dihydroxy-6-naphthoate synthase [unclassified Sphingobacterium]MVZ65835.1 1,4-dihydroxy-6-naphthoate synthase [Sphingobacterium sp. DK4209]QGA24821.1 1,4-dihydroxy-6-naphthoate synthase [Sphingobacterium sp. dk4302]
MDKLTLGFSPCPNDTFIFDALIHEKIDTEGLQFHVEYHDVETLNEKAFSNDLDITKLSYHAFAYAVEDYELLDAGSALGFGVGPLLICKDAKLAEKLASYVGGELPSELAELKIGIPGKYTTANFLLGLAFPTLTNKKEMVFSEIEKSLLDGSIDLGLIIHENRFTYMQKGLHKVADLGDFWEKTTGSPIPLGGIVIKRSLSKEVKERVNRLIKESVQFGFANPKSGLEYIRSHAQEMEEEVMYKHIELYVNSYSEQLGVEGRRAVDRMFQKARALNLIPPTEKNIYLIK